VPKTGGTSIQRAFGKRYGHNQKKWEPHRTIQQFRTKRLVQKRDPFAFTAVRNTWGRMLSVYHQQIIHKRRYDKKKYQRFLEIGFEGWVFEEATKEADFVKNQLHYITDENGKIDVDWILHFESLQADMNAMCSHLDIEPFELQYHNVRKKTKGERYQDSYTTASAKHIADHFAEEIEMFGYVF
jgi:hypothetical protein